MNSSETRVYRIAVDAMGGDFAPNNEIQGSIELFKKIDSTVKIETVFVGNENKIRSALSQFDYSNMSYSIVHADEVVTMDDEPSAAIKYKRNSSLFKGLELLQNGYVDAFVSAGNTGAVLSTATVLLGRIAGVNRPTIGSFLPTQGKYPTLLLDVGATIDTKPRFLYEFAVMGSIYTNQTLGIENPRIGLLNIGEEESKGTEAINQTYHILKNSHLNFIGNVEGSGILLGTADVVVCDGFIGNVIIKFAESFLSFLKSKMKTYANKGLYEKMSIMALAPTLKKMIRDFDYQEYGGLPLLGVNGIVIIGHGKSTPKAFKNMLKRAYELARNEINKKIEIALSPHTLTSQARKQ